MRVLASRQTCPNRVSICFSASAIWRLVERPASFAWFKRFNDLAKCAFQPITRDRLAIAVTSLGLAQIIRVAFFDHEERSGLLHERYNRTVRHEWLDQNIFETIEEALDLQQ